MFRSVSAAHLPRSLPCRHVGYAVEPIIMSSDATRSSHSNSRRRYSHSCTRHRHSHSHCCNPDRAHGLGRLCLSHAKVIYFFQIYAKIKKNRPPQAVFITCSVSIFPIYALRNFACRFISRYARRFDELAAEGQTRPVARTRIRGVVKRIRARDTAIRNRIAVTPTEHTVGRTTNPIFIAIICA